MHDCMQFDAYLSDPHHTEKVADSLCEASKLADFNRDVLPYYVRA